MKPSSTYAKTKTKPASGKPSLLPWPEVRKLPLQLLITAQGPLVGAVQLLANGAMRLYAPARLDMPTTANLMYMPIAFVEHYLQVNPALIFGTTPIPQLVAEGYVGYLEQFIKGSYKMMPVVTHVGVDAEVHGINTDSVPEVAPQPSAS